MKNALARNNIFKKNINLMKWTKKKAKEFCNLLATGAVNVSRL